MAHTKSSPPKRGQSVEKPALFQTSRTYLYFTAVVCGAAILIVEILGAKMLSPYFGTSHFVWTAQISVTLVSLAVGYYFGGRLVDRSQNFNRLYACIAAAAAYLFLTVPLCPLVAVKCLNFKLAVGSLLASTFLFLVPLALLAAVGPFLMRAMTLSVTEVGRQVGGLSALSTAGSVLGAVLVGYVLLPLLPNSATMLGTAGLLMVLAIGHFVVWGRSKAGLIASVILAVAGGAAAVWGTRVEAHQTPPGLTELYRGNSHFGLLQVLEDQQSSRRFCVNDFLLQNGYDTQRKQCIHMFSYTLYCLARAYTGKIDNALCIGLGVGIVPMRLAREGVAMDVVEINPDMVRVAEDYFDFEPSRMKVAVDDGRHFLNVNQRKYDTILLDAFLGDSTPTHLMTREAFAAMRDALAPGGTLVINSFGDLTEGHDFYPASLEKTLRTVFKSVKVHAAQATGNIFFVASDRQELEFVHQPVEPDTTARIKRLVQGALANVIVPDPSRGIVLSDDFNPVEYYDAENRERFRRKTAMAALRGRQ
ncbi:MAG: fused MFS/spermidine synthase [Planctomycetes bacterium]|nr:fused MFS/spermidine synthase [Planctomycetota bacterium]